MVSQRQKDKAGSFTQVCFMNDSLGLPSRDVIVKNIQSRLDHGGCYNSCLEAWLRSREEDDEDNLRFGGLLDITGEQTAESLADIVIEHDRLCSSTPKWIPQYEIKHNEEFYKENLTPEQYQYRKMLLAETFDESEYETLIEEMADFLIKRDRANEGRMPNLNRVYRDLENRLENIIYRKDQW